MIACAHRGLSSEYPENTIAAFRAAALHGFDAIELDVRLTHDEEVVVLHDATLDRTTDGVGRVVDLDYDEVRSHDTGEGPVPRLADAWDALRDWDGLWNIELKVPDAGAVADLIQDAGMQQRTLVSSFDPRALATVLEREPLHAALVVSGPPDDLDMATAHDLGCAWINVSHADLDAGAVARLRMAGHAVGAWTVNEVDRASALVAAGVDCVITDRREVAAAVPRGRRRW